MMRVIALAVVNALVDALCWFLHAQYMCAPLIPCPHDGNTYTA